MPFQLPVEKTQHGNR